MKRLLSVLLAATFVSVDVPAAAREADVLRARLSGCAKNIAVSKGCLPGCLLAAGDEAVPLAFGKVNDAKVAVAAATAYGKGRAVAVTHHGFFENDAADREENVAFLRACLAWLAGGKAPAVVCLDAKRRAMKDCVERAIAGWKGTRVGSLRGYGDLASLPPGANVIDTKPRPFRRCNAAASISARSCCPASSFFSTAS